MARLWLPGGSDFALSQREPNLLVPGRKPVGKVETLEFWKSRGLQLFQTAEKSVINNNLGIVADTAGLTSTRDGPAWDFDDSNKYSSFDSPIGTAGTVWVLLRNEGNEYSSAGAGKGVLASTRNSSNQGWTLELYQVSGGGAYGGKNYVNQLAFTIQGVAVYAVGVSNNGLLEYLYPHATSVSCGFASAATAEFFINGSNVGSRSIGTITGTSEPLIVGLQGPSGSGFLPLGVPVLAVAYFDRQLPDVELRLFDQHARAFSSDLLRPANATPYLIGLPGGASTHTGSGTLTGAGAAVDGVGERTVVGSGVLEGQGAAIAGTGDTAGTVAGDGALIGPGSQIVGAGVRTAKGTGALVADGSEITGVAERIVTGAGVLAGQGSVVSGAGLVEGTATGTGTLVGAGSAIVGTGERTVKGTGDLAAQGSAIVGVGERVVAGSGALVGTGSVVAGTGETGDETVGSGVLVGQGSAVVGTGERIITGAADLIGQGSIIVGTAVRTVIGSGALVGAGSEVVGLQEAQDTETSVDIFQSAADVLINALGKARAQTIVLALESGSLELEDENGNPTAYMRKRPKDWTTPDGRMTGSGWQIVCKGWEIADSDIESISGSTVTVAGKQYYVVAATPRTSGSLVLDLGYANT